MIIRKAEDGALRALGHHSSPAAHCMANTVSRIICQKAVKHENGTILAVRGGLAEMKILIQLYYMPHFIVE